MGEDIAPLVDTTASRIKPPAAGMAEAERVAAFLQAHPGWLRANPDLYAALEPPERVHGEVLADHMAAMLACARACSRAESARAESILAAGRAAAGLEARVQEAVLALIRAPDPAEWVSAELPALLGLDAATLWHAPQLPPGTAARLLGRHDVVFRDAPADARLLHHAAAPLARVDALVRVGAAGLLALASRERSRLHPGQGLRPLAFLGRALAAALARPLACP